MVKNGFYEGNIYKNVAIVGDLFEKEEDEDVWHLMSCNKELQGKNRNKILEIADLIIPGHGAPFMKKLNY